MHEELCPVRTFSSCCLAVIAAWQVDTRLLSLAARIRGTVVGVRLLQYDEHLHLDIGQDNEVAAEW